MTSAGRTLWIALLCVGTAFSAPAGAADASPWSEDSHSALRLIAGTNEAGAALLRAGVEIKMQPGWKTYWRYPGDSGEPPRFDFAGSDNVAGVTVLFPAPHLFSDEAGNTLGYKGGVTFPLRVAAKEPGKPVRLRAKIDYAICEKLCVPAQGRAELALAPGASGHEAALRAAEALVPMKITPERAGLAVHRVDVAGKPTILLDLKAKPDTPMDVFVEGPTPEWALPIPKPAPGAPEGYRRFAFALDGLPPGADPKGKLDLTFTVIGPGRPVEVTTHLD
jgi:DsbC/DsbD-like thiol-disulfide interchange protein